jgi:hypothetical protein
MTLTEPDSIRGEGEECIIQKEIGLHGDSEGSR